MRLICLLLALALLVQYLYYNQFGWADAHGVLISSKYLLQDLNPDRCIETDNLICIGRD
jgi:hypothetical protein